MPEELWGRLRPIEQSPPVFVKVLHDEASLARGRNRSFYVHSVTWLHNVPAVVVQVDCATREAD